MTVAELVVVPGILLALALAGALALLARALSWRFRADRATLKNDAASRKAFRLLEEANALAAGAIEADPAIGMRFPADVRDKMLAAHAAASEVAITRKG